MSLPGKEARSALPFATGSKLALEGRCKDSVVTEPELFLRIQSKGEPVDDFLSVTGGGPGDWPECFLSRCERLDRSLSSCKAYQGWSSDTRV